jgi:hypothetical protein
LTFNNISNKIITVIQIVIKQTKKNTKGGVVMRKPVWAIKFKRFCEDHQIAAEEVARALNLSRASVYMYWSGRVPVSDQNKKVLERKLGLPIYETFFNEEL